MTDSRNKTIVKTSMIGIAVKAIGKTIMEFPTVHGVYDLVLHDYGPDSYQGSAHIEVPDTCSANELDNLIRSITIAVYKYKGVVSVAAR